MTARPAVTSSRPWDWRAVRDGLRARGQRWTNQRRIIVDVLAESTGHVTGAELVDRCRELDPATVPSTVYRTLDVFESLGFIRHGHGSDGREEYHVLPAREHGHLHCSSCGSTWELSPAEAAPLIAALTTSRGFELDLSHLSVGGRCPSCVAQAGPARAEGVATPAVSPSTDTFGIPDETG